MVSGRDNHTYSFVLNTVFDGGNPRTHRRRIPQTTALAVAILGGIANITCQEEQTASLATGGDVGRRRSQRDRRHSMAAPSTTQASKAAVREFIERFNQGSLDGLADDYVEHNRAYPGETVSRDELEAKMDHLAEALPDLTLTVDDMVAEGEKVAVSATATATHAGEFYDVEATGERLEWALMLIARVENDRVAGIWVLRDVLGIMTQLGLISES